MPIKTTDVVEGETEPVTEPKRETDEPATWCWELWLVLILNLRLGTQQGRRL